MDETTCLDLFQKGEAAAKHGFCKLTIRKGITWLVPIFGLLITSCTHIPVAANFGTVPIKNTEFMLTFDDGPLPEATGRVLDMLATLRATDGTPVKAGFFLLADAPETFWQRRYHYAPFELWTGKGSIAKYPDTARDIKQAGHLIGNHTTHHSWFHWPWLNTQKAVLAEFAEWEAIVAPILGVPEVRLFRPPYFFVTSNVQEVAEGLGYQIVLGESVGDATPNMSVEEIKLKNAKLLASWDKPYPCVLVFHDMRPATYEHLAEIVTYLQQQGFRLVHFDPSRL
jgi:peptidoglycan-N-acetylglucosamine deacetylase